MSYYWPATSYNYGYPYSPYSPHSPLAYSPAPSFSPSISVPSPVNYPAAYPATAPLYATVNKDRELEEANREYEKAKKKVEEAESRKVAAQIAHSAAEYAMHQPPTYGFASAVPSVVPLATPAIPLSYQYTGQPIWSPSYPATNFFMQPPTPPTYINVSPAPPSYPDLGAPEEAVPDKWKNGMHEPLYDNYHDPGVLNGSHSQLEVHPVLSWDGCNGEGFPLVADLASGRENITWMDKRERWFSSNNDVLREPATLPRATKLRLVSKKYSKYIIEVRNPKGVTVGDVVNQIYNEMERPLDVNGRDMAPNHKAQQLREQAFAANSRHNLGYGIFGHHLRRVDLLAGEPALDGLSAAPDLSHAFFGGHDCAVLEIHFKPRGDYRRLFF